MAIWAVTGGIACGKSAVVNAFKALGITCYSADEDAKDVLNDPDVNRKVRSAFPDSIDSQGQLDRAMLGRLIFADDDRRALLGQIMHPYIRERMRARIEQNHASTVVKLELYEVPLLFEGGLEAWFDGTICVTCKPEVQTQRLIDRHYLRYQSRMSEEEVKHILNSQIPVKDKAIRSDIVIDNSGTEDDVIQAVKTVLATLNITATP